MEFGGGVLFCFSYVYDYAGILYFIATLAEPINPRCGSTKIRPKELEVFHESDASGNQK